MREREKKNGKALKHLMAAIEFDLCPWKEN